MKKGKAKLTRHDAERLFEGLPKGNVRASSRPENPFDAGVFDVVKHVDDKAKLWKDNLITIPMAVELPAGYESVSRLREAMVRAWRVKWVREPGKRTHRGPRSLWSGPRLVWVGRRCRAQDPATVSC
jgi:hypothetical protein